MRFLDAPGSGIREFPEETTDLDTSGCGWTAHNVIRNQQVSGSSPLAGSRLSPYFSATYGRTPTSSSVASARVGCT